MKIIIYNPAHISYSSGPEIWLLHCIPLLRGLDNEITLVTTRLGERQNNVDYEAFFSSIGVNYIVLNSFEVPLSGTHLPKSFNKIKGYYDVTYAIYGYAFQDVIGYIIAKKTRSSLIYGSHSPSEYLSGIQSYYYRMITKSLFRLSSGVHVLNSDDLKSIRSRNTFKVGYGINQRHKQEKISKDISGSDKIKIIFLGRLDEQKNIPMLLEIIKKLEYNENVEFYIAGRGKYEKLVVNSAKDLRNLTFLGFVDNKLIEDLYSDKHVFINLSRYETFCGAILEALDNDLIILATNTSGIVKDNPELIHATYEYVDMINVVVRSIDDLARMVAADKNYISKQVMNNRRFLENLNTRTLTQELNNEFSKAHENTRKI